MQIDGGHASLCPPSIPRTDEPTACRKRRRRSAPMRHRAQPYATDFRLAPKANARKGADGLPPIIHAWSISNAPSLEWNTVRGGMQDDPKNSDTNSPAESNCSQKFPAMGFGRELYSFAFDADWNCQ